MNKIYKVVWSRARQCYVVVSEYAKRTGKSASTKKLLAALMAAGIAASAGVMTASAEYSGSTASIPQYVAIKASSLNNVNFTKGSSYHFSNGSIVEGAGSSDEQTYVYDGEYLVRKNYEVNIQTNKYTAMSSTSNAPLVIWKGAGVKPDDVLETVESSVTTTATNTNLGEKLNSLEMKTYIALTNTESVNAAGSYNYVLNDDSYSASDVNSDSKADGTIAKYQVGEDGTVWVDMQGDSTSGPRNFLTTENSSKLTFDSTTQTYKFNGKEVDYANLYVIDGKVGVFVNKDQTAVYTGNVYGSNNEIFKTAKQGDQLYSYWGAIENDPTATMDTYRVAEYESDLNTLVENDNKLYRNDINRAEMTVDESSVKTEGSTTTYSKGTISLYRNGTDGTAAVDGAVTVAGSSEAGKDSKITVTVAGYTDANGQTTADQTITLDAGSRVAADVVSTDSTSKYYNELTNNKGQNKALTINGTDYKLPVYHDADGNLLSSDATANVVANSIALGVGASVGTSGSLQNGVTAAIAIGEAAGAGHNDTVAIGHTAIAGGTGAVAVGKKTSASESSVAIGEEAVAGKHSVAIGGHEDDTTAGLQDHITQAEGTYSVIIGTNSYSNANTGSVGVGSSVKVTATRGAALGYMAEATGAADSIAIGSYSATDNGRVETDATSAKGYKTAAAYYGWDPSTGAVTTDATKSGSAAWVATLGSVSVGGYNSQYAGGAQQTRQITNVAAGSTDTDAVNVAQLKALRTYVDQNSGNGSWNLATEVVGTTAAATTTISNTNTVTMAGANGLEVTQETQKNGDTVTGTKVTIGLDSTTKDTIDRAVKYDTYTQADVDAGLTTAENIGKVNKNSVSLEGTTYNRKVETTKGDNDEDITTVTYEGGTTLSNIAYAVTDREAANYKGSAAVNVDLLNDKIEGVNTTITNSTFGLKTGSTSATQKLDGTIAVEGKKGIVATASGTNDTAKLEISLSKDITVGTATDGEHGVDGEAGSIGLSGKDSHSTDTKETYTVTTIKTEYVNGKDGIPGLAGKDGVDGITRIIYSGEDGDHTVATLDDGLNFTGDDTNVTIGKKLNETLQIAGAAGSGITSTVKTKTVGEGDDAKTEQYLEIGFGDKINIGGTVGEDGNVTGGVTIGKTVTKVEGGEDKTDFYVTGLTNTTWDGTNYVSGRAATEDQLKVVDTKVGDLDKNAVKYYVYTEEDAEEGLIPAGKKVGDIEYNAVILGGDEYTTSESQGVKTYEGGTTISNLAYAATDGDDYDGSAAVNVDLLKDYTSTYVAANDYSLKNGNESLGQDENGNDIAYGTGANEVKNGYKADEKGNFDLLVSNGSDTKHVILTDVASKSSLDTLNDYAVKYDTTTTTTEGPNGETVTTTTINYNSVTFGGDTYVKTTENDKTTYTGGTTVKNVAYAEADRTSQNYNGSAAVNVDLLNDKIDKVSGDLTNATFGLTTGSTSATSKVNNTIAVEGAKGIVATATGDNGENGEAKLTISLSKDITVGTATDGEKGVDGEAGSIGLSGKDSHSTDTKETYTVTTIKTEYVNGKDGIPGLAGKDGVNGITRIIYSGEDGDHTVATLDDGLNFTGDDANVTIGKKLNETLQIKGAAGSGITSTVKEGALEIGFGDKINIGGTVGEDGNVTGGVTIGKTVTKVEGGEDKTDFYVTGLTNTTWDGTNYVSGRAATEDQLKVVDGKVADVTAGAVKYYKDGDNYNYTKVVLGEGDDYQAYNSEAIKGGDDGETIITPAHSGGTHITNVAYAETDKTSQNYNGGEAVNVDLLNDKISDVNTTITNSTFGLKTGSTSATQKLDGTIAVEGKKGIVATATGTDAEAKLEISLDKDITVGTAGEKGEAGSIGIAGKDGKDGEKGESTSITTIRTEYVKGADGAPGADGKDGITRIIYKDPEGNDNKVATLDDGLYFAGDDAETKISKKLNETLQIAGAAGSGITSTVKTKTVGEGDDAKTEQYLEIGFGDKINIGGTVGEDGNVTGGVTIGKTVTKVEGGEDKTDFYVTGLTNTTWDGTNYVSGRAATEDQLKVVDGKVNALDQNAVKYDTYKEGDTIPDGKKAGDINYNSVTMGGTTYNKKVETTKGDDDKEITTVTYEGGTHITNVAYAETDKTSQKYNGGEAVNVDLLNDKISDVTASLTAAEKHVQAGEYEIGTDGKVTMNIVDGNETDTGTTVVIKDVAKATDVGDVDEINDDLKNYETNDDGSAKLDDNGNKIYTHTSTVEAINKIDNKVNDVDAGSVKYVKDGDSYDYSKVSLAGTTYSNKTGGTTITNVAYSDGTGSDAVNVDYLTDKIKDATDSMTAAEKHVQAGEYEIGTDGKVTLKVEDGNGKELTETVVIKDVAKASDVGDVDQIADDLKNKDQEGKSTHTSTVDAINNLNNKVGDQKYSEVTNKSEALKDGDDTTTAIAKLDQKLTETKKLAGQHSTVSEGNGIKVTESDNANGSKNYEVSLKPEITLGDKDNDGKLTVTGKNGSSVAIDGKDGSVTAGTVTINKDGAGTVGGLTNKTWDPEKITSGQAATEDQLQKVDQNSVKYYVYKDGDTIPDGKKAGDVDYTKITLGGEGGTTITNVKAGDLSETSTDAVNGSQLYATNQQVTNNSIAITNVAGTVNKLGNRINRVGAGAAALAALHPLDFDPDAKWDFAAGYGNYRGANAAAVGAYYRPNEDLMFSVGGSFGGGENMVNAGVSVKIGAGSSHVSTSRVAMAKEIKDLREQLEAVKSALLDANVGKKIDTSKLQLFPDVPDNHWAYEYVSTLAGNGMVEGYPDGEYKGDRPMTRYEFAAILYRAMTKGAVLSERLLTEFAPELERFTVDTVKEDKEGNPTIQRVRTVKENLYK